MARQGKRLIKRLICGAAFAVLIIAIAAIVGIAVSANSNEEVLRAQIIELNDTRAELPSSSSDDRDTVLLKADQALEHTQDALRQAAGSRDTSSAAAIALITLIVIAVISLMTFYLYRVVAQPFAKLEGFAEEVASGNLDAPLAYERSNPFGKFTWAFDNLRCELSRAKKDEEQAREDYKTALASLSHDLRTPLASLRAYAETLEMGLIDSDAERAEYERAIMRKCDEVSSLVEDLFQHALSDMDRISVQCKPVQAARIIERCASDSAGLVRISCKRLEDAVVQADEMRLAQVIDNLIGNSIKYASGSALEIEAAVEDGMYAISVRDFGSGMSPEDIPFATERFFRGSNVSDQPGSGLGLFISSYLAQRMGGHLRVENAHPGLKVTIELPLLGRDLE